MARTTLNIVNNLIVIHLDKIENVDGVFIDCDKQTVVFLTTFLGGYIINYSDKSITLYLTLNGINSYEVDFKRGGGEREVIQANFDNAVAILTGNEIKKRKREL